jgi:hypothetical protein
LVGVKLVFANIGAATLTYTVDGKQVSKQIERFSFAPEALRYTEKVYVIWTGAYPFYVEKKADGTYTVEKVKNMTQYQGTFPLLNCWMYVRAMVDGKVLVSCIAAADNIRHALYVDPNTQELREYSGKVPAMVAGALDPGWIDVQAFDPTTPAWGRKARVADGWYYAPSGATWTLMFQKDSGQTITVKSGTFSGDGGINAILSYSN